MKEESKPLDKPLQLDSGQHYILPKKVAILFSEVKREYFPTEEQYITEKDAQYDAEVIAEYLIKMGVSTKLYPGTPDALEKVRSDKPDMVLNLVASVRGQEFLAATIPAALEFMGIPYTGAGILGESLAYNKFLVKKLLQQNGVPVPNYQLFNTPTDPINSDMRFPLITKLNEIHGAVEITKDSVSDNEKHLRERLKFLMNVYKQPVLAEEFIVGKEVTAILFEGLNKKVYIAEKVFNKPNDKYVFATFEDQWLASEKEEEWAYNYKKYEDAALKDLVRKAFEISKMDDYAKFDIRIDSSGRYYFIDSNTNPAFGPKELDAAMAYIFELHSIDFNDILKRLLANTVRDSVKAGNGNGNGTH